MIVVVVELVSTVLFFVHSARSFVLRKQTRMINGMVWWHAGETRERPEKKEKKKRRNKGQN